MSFFKYPLNYPLVLFMFTFSVFLQQYLQYSAFDKYGMFFSLKSCLSCMSVTVHRHRTCTQEESQTIKENVLLQYFNRSTVQVQSAARFVIATKTTRKEKSTTYATYRICFLSFSASSCNYVNYQ